jgi:hypothetical protein
MEEYERKNKEEIHKELQDLDPMGSPHKEEKVIGGNIDLDLLSLFPPRYARTMEGIQRRESFPRSTMEGERREKRAQRVRGCWNLLKGNMLCRNTGPRMAIFSTR